MKILKEPVRNWFGHTRRERRASSVLLGIIATIISVRFLFPAENINVEDVSYLYSDSTGSDTSFSATERPGRSEGSLVPAVSIKQDRAFKKDTQKLQKRHVIIDLNSCDSLELLGLPGIGPVLSARIIKYRNLLGGYAGVEQLKEVYGIKEETYNIIREYLRADSSLIRRVRINEAGYRELGRIPYMEKYEISAILKYRQLKGKIGSTGELVENKILAADKAARVKFYIDFR